MAALVGPGAALAAPPTFAPDVVLDSEWVDPYPAVDTTGNVFVIAVDFTTKRVEVASRGPTSTAFTSPAQLSAVGKVARDPRVAFDSSGNALAIWEDTTDKEIEVAFDAVPLSVFSASASISTTGETVVSPDVALDPSGNALAIWDNNTDNTIEFAFRPAGLGFTSPPAAIAGAGATPDSPAIAFDPAGNALAVWGAGPVPARIMAASRPAGGSFSTPVPISAAGKSAHDPKLAIDDQGNALVAYKNGTDNSTEVVTRAAGAATFSTPTPLSNPGDDTGDRLYMDLAVGPAGLAAVSWPNQTDGVAEVAIRPAAGAPFSSPIVMSGNASPDDTRVAFDAHGNLVAIWDNENKDVIEAVSRPACTGTFSRVVDASDVSGPDGPELVLDQQGDPVAVWDGSQGGEVAEGDSGAGPVLSQLQVPSQGVAGTRLDFSVNPLDLAGVADVTWRFGDGGSAGTNSASNVYASRGSYEVTVSATDTRQNSCTERRLVQLADPPVTPPDPEPPVTPPDLEPDSSIAALASPLSARKLKRFRGTASDPENRLARVEIAVLQVSGGAKAARASRAVCRRLASDGRLRVTSLTGGRCQPKTFLAAAGTSSWSFRLKRQLPAGRYVLYSRAVDQAGNSERSFSSKDGNRATFRLK